MTPTQQKAINKVLMRIVVINNIKTIQGTVNLSAFYLTELPDLSDVVVDGDFECYQNTLTSLKGCPHTVNGDFNCSSNQLTSLQHCPKTVGRDFVCSYNQLTSLNHCPTVCHRAFYCHNNQLTSLKYAPKIINGNFCCSYNQLTTLEHSPHTINGVFDCSNNLLQSLKYAPTHLKTGFYGNYNPWIKELTTSQMLPISISSELSSEDYAKLIEHLETQANLAYIKANPIEVTTVNIEI